MKASLIPIKLFFNYERATGLTIDGEVYENNTSYTELGYHELIIYGFGGYRYYHNFSIAVDEKTTPDNSIFSKFMNMTINGAERLILNSIEIENGSNIDTIGNHTLQIYGTNGYIETISFTILPDLSVKNDGTYTSAITIEKLNARMLLNGEELTEDVTIDKHGNYTLEIIGANGYKKIIEFKYIDEVYTTSLAFAIPVFSLSSLGGVYLLIRRKRVI